VRRDRPAGVPRSPGPHHYVYGRTGTCPRRVRATAPRLYRILCGRAGGGLVLAGGPCLLATQGGYDPKAQLLPRGVAAFSRRTTATGRQSSSPGVGLELIVGNYYVLHPARVHRGHRMRPAAYPVASGPERARSRPPSPMPCGAGTSARRRPVGQSAFLIGRRGARLRCTPGTCRSPGAARSLVPARRPHRTVIDVD